MRFCVDNEKGVVFITTSDRRDTDRLRKVLKIVADCKPESLAAYELSCLFCLSPGHPLAWPDEDEPFASHVLNALRVCDKREVELLDSVRDNKFSMARFYALARCGLCQHPVVKVGECLWKRCALCREECCHDWSGFVGPEDNKYQYCRNCGFRTDGV